MSSFDKDFRYMALNDLMSQLCKDAFKMDERLERKVCPNERMKESAEEECLTPVLTSTSHLFLMHRWSHLS